MLAVVDVINGDAFDCQLLVVDGDLRDLHRENAIAPA
jgi:hypothetical protein